MSCGSHRKTQGASAFTMVCASLYIVGALGLIDLRLGGVEQLCRPRGLEKPAELPRPFVRRVGTKMSDGSSEPLPQEVR